MTNLEYYKCNNCTTIINSDSYNRCYHCDGNSGLYCDDCIEKHLQICGKIEDI